VLVQLRRLCTEQLQTCEDCRRSIGSCRAGSVPFPPQPSHRQQQSAMCQLPSYALSTRDSTLFCNARQMLLHLVSKCSTRAAQPMLGEPVLAISQKAMKSRQPSQRPLPLQTCDCNEGIVSPTPCPSDEHMLLSLDGGGLAPSRVGLECSLAAPSVNRPKTKPCRAWRAPPSARTTATLASRARVSARMLAIPPVPAYHHLSL
jgi:hypothetical protein